MSEPKLFNIGVKALIENNEGKILLMKADITNHREVDEAYWDIPGGRIEEGDGALKTLKREIHEETGITKLEAEPKFFTAVISNHQIPAGDKILGLALMIYKVRIPEGIQIKISAEHTAHAWADKKEAAKRLSNKYPKEFTDKLADADD